MYILSICYPVKSDGTVSLYWNWSGGI